MNQVLLTMLGAVLGALLGSLGTVVVFSHRLVRVETRQDNFDKNVIKAEGFAEKAQLQANKAWGAVRELRGYAKGQTNEVPRFTSGENDAV